MKTKLNTAMEIYKRHGVIGIIIYTVRILLFRRSSTNRIFLYILDEPKPSTVSIEAAKDHIFRFATIEDIQYMLSNEKWDIQGKHIDAYHRGDKCLLQLDGDNIVGYTWVIFNPLIEIAWGFHFNMPNDTVYNYKGFTAPEYRGKNFQPLRHLKILEYAMKDGKTRLFGYVDHLNLNSQKGVAKSGYKKIGVLTCKNKYTDYHISLKVKNDCWSKERRN